MNILVVGVHRHRNQPSMALFGLWMAKSLASRGRVRPISAPPLFLNRWTHRWPGAKWLFYLDQFVLLPLLLALIHHRYDLVAVVDHSNAFATRLVPGRKLAAMVHDMVGVRLALEGLAEGPPVGASGRLLQRLVLVGLRRMRRLAVSAEKVSRELARFGVAVPTCPVGCPLEPARIALSREPAALRTSLAGRRFVLNVATDDWRKRKPFLVAAWAALHRAHPDAPVLVLAGYTRPETLAQAEATDGAVIAAREIGDAELVWLYRHCEGTVAASTEEGFCIPILESIYFAKPVIGVRDAAYVEIFGDAVLPFDIAPPEVTAERIHALLTDEAALRGALARRDDLVRHFSFPAFSRRLVAAVGLDGPTERRRAAGVAAGRAGVEPA